MNRHYYDQDGRWQAERRLPTVMFTGTPIMPYMVIEPPRSEWEIEEALAKRTDGAPRYRTDRLATMRQALGGAVIRAGERLAGPMSDEALPRPSGDLNATC